MAPLDHHLATLSQHTEKCGKLTEGSPRRLLSPLIHHSKSSWPFLLLHLFLGFIFTFRFRCYNLFLSVIWLLPSLCSLPLTIHFEAGIFYFFIIYCFTFSKIFYFFCFTKNKKQVKVITFCQFVCVNLHFEFVFIFFKLWCFLFLTNQASTNFVNIFLLVWIMSQFINIFSSFTTINFMST